MNLSVFLRNVCAVFIALGLSYHGLSKRSLNISGCIAAIFVGYAAFACSYRCGLLLILFYYSSSKLTKWREEFKARFEENYAVGGQRNWMQVFASSILATAVGIAFYLLCGEDQHISFGAPVDPTDNLAFFGLTINRSTLAAYLWVVYIAHYCTANADTWASELGVLSKTEPRLVTTLFLRRVPRGTNGGMSTLGTVASGAGGLFIGVIFYVCSFFSMVGGPAVAAQYPVLVYSLLCGLLGSLVDSLMGATVQATYYSRERQCIVKHGAHARDGSIVRICGVDLLSNEAVNFWSIFVTMVLSVWLAPNVYCWVDGAQCFEADKLKAALSSFTASFTAK